MDGERPAPGQIGDGGAAPGAAGLTGRRPRADVDRVREGPQLGLETFGEFGDVLEGRVGVDQRGGADVPCRGEVDEVVQKVDRGHGAGDPRDGIEIGGAAERLPDPADLLLKRVFVLDGRVHQQDEVPAGAVVVGAPEYPQVKPDVV